MSEPLRIGLCGFSATLQPWMRRQMELSVAGLKHGFFHRL